MLLFTRRASSLLALSSLLPRVSHTFSMSTFITERNDGTITVSPKDEASQSGLVVISHGLGDTAEGFCDVAEVCTRL